MQEQSVMRPLVGIHPFSLPMAYHSLTALAGPILLLILGIMISLQILNCLITYIKKRINSVKKSIQQESMI